MRKSLISTAFAAVVAVLPVSAVACPCSLGAAAAGFATLGVSGMPSYPWQYRSGAEYQGGATLPASNASEFTTTAQANSSVTYPSNAFAMPAGTNWNREYSRASSVTSWSGPGGKVLSAAQMGVTLGSARNSGAAVVERYRPTGWLRSNLPNTIGHSIYPSGQAGVGSSITYTVRQTDKWTSKLVEKPYDPNFCTSGCD